MTILSEALCIGSQCCPGIDTISTTNPYTFQYESKVLTASNQLEWAGYISFPYDIVYLSGTDINCASSFLYSTNTFYQWIQINSDLCVYNTSYTNIFVALRQVSASQTLTIYFDETRRRNLCGFCGCNTECEQNIAIIFGIISGLFILVCFYFCCVKTNVIKNIFDVKKKITIKPRKNT